jgi:hypothetical protein
MGLKKNLERRTAMQVDGVAHGVGTIPRRRRLNALLTIVAVVVIAAMVALMVWAGAPARSGVGAEEANPKAGTGTAVIHDGAGHMFPEAGAGSTPIHDDAGSVNR